jgi:hypothetical protein
VWREQRRILDPVVQRALQVLSTGVGLNTGTIALAKQYKQQWADPNVELVVRIASEGRGDSVHWRGDELLPLDLALTPAGFAEQFVAGTREVLRDPSAINYAGRSLPTHAAVLWLSVWALPLETAGVNATLSQGRALLLCCVGLCITCTSCRKAWPDAGQTPLSGGRNYRGLELEFALSARSPARDRRLLTIPHCLVGVELLHTCRTTVTAACMCKLARIDVAPLHGIGRGLTACAQWSCFTHDHDAPTTAWSLESKTPRPRAALERGRCNQ